MRGNGKSFPTGFDLVGRLLLQWAGVPRVLQVTGAQGGCQVIATAPRRSGKRRPSCVSARPDEDTDRNDAGVV